MGPEKSGYLQFMEHLEAKYFHLPNWRDLQGDLEDVMLAEELMGKNWMPRFHAWQRRVMPAIEER